MNVVDLGTEFTLKINKGKAPELFVHEGEVLLNSKKNNKTLKSVVTSQGYSWQNEHFSAIAPFKENISFAELNQLTKAARQEKLLRWQKYADTIKQRDDVILFYSFQNEDDSARSIQNESKLKDKNLNGAIVGAQWSRGRWHGKQALSFQSTGDRIRLNIPGEYDAMTFSTWIQIRSFDRWLSSLILTDNHDQGELHWQLSDSGEIILGAQQNGNTLNEQHDDYHVIVSEFVR